TPLNLRAYSNRGPTGSRQVLEEERGTPPPQPPRKQLKHHSSNYQSSVPAKKLEGRLFHYYNPRPELCNMPENNKGVMTSEDNAFATCQVVATSLADDQNHYIHEDEVTINKGWLYRDLKSQAMRVSDTPSNCCPLSTPIFNPILLDLQNVVAIVMAQRLQTNTDQRVAELLNDKRKLEEEKEQKEEELTLTKGYLETNQEEANMLREQMAANSRVARAEQVW
ncbi:hypothetical protein Dimus_003565, partial [Dionaea muscipula]